MLPIINPTTQPNPPQLQTKKPQPNLTQKNQNLNKPKNKSYRLTSLSNRVSIK